MGVIGVIARVLIPTRLGPKNVLITSVVGVVDITVRVDKVGCGRLLKPRLCLRLRSILRLLPLLLKLPLDPAL